MTVVGPAGRPGAPTAAILEDLRDIAPMVAGTRLRVTGLHFGSSTVYAQIKGSGGDLVGARRVLRERWASTPSIGVEAVFRDRLMWTNQLIRCTVRPTPEFVAAVARRRGFPGRLVPDRGDRAGPGATGVMAEAMTVSLGTVPIPAEERG